MGSEASPSCPELQLPQPQGKERLPHSPSIQPTASLSPLTQRQIVSFPAPSSGSQPQPSPHMLPPSWSFTTPWSCSPNGPYISPRPTTEPGPERKLPCCTSVQTRSTLPCYGYSTDSDLSHWPSLQVVSPVPPALPYPNASPHSPITSIS